MQIACTILVISAEAERTFNRLNLIKTHLRTKMTDTRLSNVAVVSVHAARANKLDLERVVEHFIMMYHHRRIILK